MLLSPRRAGVLAVSLSLVAGLAACGGASSSVSTTGSSSAAPAAGAAPAADAALAAMVPADVKADGVLTIGTDSTYAPSEFLDADGKTVIGFDVDLFNTVAAKLGLRTKWVSAPFDNIIPSVGSGKYEIGVSALTINADRVKQADMIGYFSAGTQWATQAGNPKQIRPDDACGKRIAVQRGTVQVDDITAKSTACTGAGKAAVTIDQYQGQDQATAAVMSGKDDAMLADSPVAAYAVKQTQGKLELLGDIYDSAPYGYLVKKGQAQFGEALVGALKALQTDGTYKTVLDKWGVAQGAIDTFAVNPQVG